jgi:hypothetical protein
MFIQINPRRFPRTLHAILHEEFLQRRANLRREIDVGGAGNPQPAFRAPLEILASIAGEQPHRCL